MASLVEELAGAGCVYAEEEAAILLEAAATAGDLAAMVARRTSGEPLEHVVGWTDFRGLRLAIDPGVFVPRPRSGFLVQEAAAVLRGLAGAGREVVVVDLCCGIGALGSALVEEVPGVSLHAVDVDPRAVACDERNLGPRGGRVHRGDLFDALPHRLRGRVDLVVTSPPYVPTEQLRLLPTEAREFEAPLALDGGPDGLDVVRRIAGGAPRWLTPGGWLALEVGERQVEVAVRLLAELGWDARGSASDEHGSGAVLAQDKPELA